MTPTTRRVLHVLANGGRGGMQSQVRLIAGAMAARGDDVVLAVGGGDVAELEGVHLTALPTFDARRPWSFLAALRRETRRMSFDVVHGHGLRLAPFVARSGAPTRVVTCHGIDPRRVGATARLVRRSRVTFISCGEGPRSLLASHGITSQLIDNALGPLEPNRSLDEARATFDLDGDAPLIVLPARLSPQKNHEGLLEALAVVRDQLGRESPEVLALGDGPLLEVVRARAKRPGDRPLLHCPGYRDDASQWLGASAFFVLPSLWEGQPLVVLEALARNLSVATCTPVGVEDLVSDGRNGRRVRSPRELAEVITAWVRDPSSRPTDPPLTERVLARHELATVVSAHDALYDELTTPPR